MDFQRILGWTALFITIGVVGPTLGPALVDYYAATQAVSRVDAMDKPEPAASAAPPVRAAEPALPPRTSARTVALSADRMGQFEATAVINGHALQVIVDTGATTVALSSEAARKLGVLPPPSAFRLPVSTANGTVEVAPVMLREVRVSGVSVRDVQAVVIPGRVLTMNLLGMSFLSRLKKFELSGSELRLTE